MKKIHKILIILAAFIILFTILNYVDIKNIYSKDSNMGMVDSLREDYKDYYDYKEINATKSNGEIYNSYNKLTVQTMIALDCINIYTIENPEPIIESYCKFDNSSFSKSELKDSVEKEISSLTHTYSNSKHEYMKLLVNDAVKENVFSTFQILVTLSIGYFVYKKYNYNDKLLYKQD